MADGTSPLGSMTRCYEQTVASFFNPHSNELYVPVTSQQQDLRFAPITATPPSLPCFFHTSPLALSSSRCRWTNPAGPLPRPTHHPVLPSAAGSPARADPQPALQFADFPIRCSQKKTLTGLGPASPTLQRGLYGEGQTPPPVPPLPLRGPRGGAGWAAPIIRIPHSWDGSRALRCPRKDPNLSCNHSVPPN